MPDARTGSSPPSGALADGWNTLGAWVLGGAAAIVTVIHVGALLAAPVFRGTHLDGTVTDTATAIIGLPQHLDDPSAAWPAHARATLPGPVALWACLLMAAATAGAFAWVGWHAWRRILGSGRPNELGIVPNAGFARRRDIRRLAVPSPQPGRLTLGRTGRQLLAAEPQASLAVIGPTGCGKTAGFAIPALWEWEGPIIATSVKADLLAATVKHRSRGARKVWIYDPTSSAGFVPCARWSPLTACNTWPGAMRMAAWLAEAAQPRLDTVSDGDYWFSQARKGLAPYLHAGAVDGRTMSDVVGWVDAQETTEVEVALRRSVGLEAALAEAMASAEAEARRAAHREEVRTATIEALRAVLADKPARAAIANRPVISWPVEMQEDLDDRVAFELDALVEAEFESEITPSLSVGGRLAPLITARSLWERDSRLRDSVFATMQNVLAGYAEPDVGAACQNPNLDFSDWLSGDNTIYVVATAHEQARLRPVLTVLVQQAIRAAYDTAALRGGSLAHPCLVLLDEAGNIAPLRDLPGYASTARSHGITLVSVWQDLAQIKATYRDRAQTVLNNHRAKLFGTGIADEATLDYVSRLIGDEARTERNVSADVGGARRSISEHTMYRRTAPADVLRRIRPNNAVLVYGSELPVHIRLRPWFDEPALRERAGVETDSRKPVLPRRHAS